MAIVGKVAKKNKKSVHRGPYYLLRDRIVCASHLERPCLAQDSYADLITRQMKYRIDIAPIANIDIDLSFALQWYYIKALRYCSVNQWAGHSYIVEDGSSSPRLLTASTVTSEARSLMHTRRSSRPKYIESSNSFSCCMRFICTRFI